MVLAQEEMGACALVGAEEQWHQSRWMMDTETGAVIEAVMANEMRKFEAN